MLLQASSGWAVLRPVDGDRKPASVFHISGLALGRNGGHVVVQGEEASMSGLAMLPLDMCGEVSQLDPWLYNRQVSP